MQDTTSTLVSGNGSYPLKNGQSNAPFFLGVTEKVFDLILGETERDTVEGGPEPPASKCIIA